jgi:hypothetical protein
MPLALIVALSALTASPDAAHSLADVSVQRVESRLDFGRRLEIVVRMNPPVPGVPIVVTATAANPRHTRRVQTTFVPRRKRPDTAAIKIGELRLGTDYALKVTALSGDPPDVSREIVVTTPPVAVRLLAFVANARGRTVRVPLVCVGRKRCSARVQIRDRQGRQLTRRVTRHLARGSSFVSLPLTRYAVRRLRAGGHLAVDVWTDPASPRAAVQQLGAVGRLHIQYRR